MAKQGQQKKNRDLQSNGELGSSAYDVESTKQPWNGLSDADLKQLPVVPEGTGLQEGAVYFDLNNPDRGEIRAHGDMAAGPENRYVAKSAVPYPLWNALIGAEDQEHLNVGDER